MTVNYADLRKADVLLLQEVVDGEQSHVAVEIAKALGVDIENPAGQVRIINTHLDNRINQEEKQAQLAAIFEGISSYSGPCVIGGDFNTGGFLWVNHVLPLPHFQNLREAMDQKMRRHGFSTPLGSGPRTLHFMGLKLDWIYLRGLTARDSGVTPIPFQITTPYG